MSCPRSAECHTPRKRLLLDRGWRFKLGDALISGAASDDQNMTTYLESKTGFAEGPADPKYDDHDWRVLNLPHDWAVEGPLDAHNNPDHGYLQAGIGWYRRTFYIPTTDLGKIVSVEFDGVFRKSTVWVNGHRLGTHHSGYTSFRYDLSDALNYGETNVLAVRVDASDFEGWWYEGAGIYRHVWLVTTDSLHIAPWGIYVNPQLDASLQTCQVRIQTKLNNFRESRTEMDLRSTIIDSDGRVCAEILSSLILAEDASSEVVQEAILPTPTLWSVDTPYLYQLVSSVEQDGMAVDACTTSFGIRSIRFDAATGFYLNGQSLKLKGTCNHQDHAGVGVALPDRIHTYRIERLKEMGCNAYRCSHNPPAPELLDACDRLGMLVMDETRRMDSSPEGMAQFESMILRDRNHPSIILWSLGNEEPIQGTDIGTRIVKSMKRFTHKHDTTRSVTLAMNGGWGSKTSEVLDVQGCNYAIQLYDDFHQRLPGKPMIAAENGSTVCTRGIYQNDEGRGYVSAYDANHPSWAFLAEDSWKAVADRPFVAGTFVWTGFDYRGEPTPYRWPCVNSHFGILDMCGFPKDNYYYYQAWWSNKTVLHILPHWTWAGKEGQPVAVWVHSNCDEVELFLNGTSLGRQVMQRNGRLEWTVDYEPGVLMATGFRAGSIVASSQRQTTGAPHHIEMKADRITLAADCEDVALVTVCVADVNGLVAPLANNFIHFAISDNARIIGVGNGDPSCHEADKARERSAFGGFCQVIVQAGETTGSIILTAQSDGLQACEITIQAIPAVVRPYVN